MRPPLSVTGTRWTRWTPLSNFSCANTPCPVDAGDDFLEAARIRRPMPRSARPASPARRHSAGTCGTGRPRTAPPRRRRCRRGFRASPARSSAASRGSSDSASARSAASSAGAFSRSSSARHRAQFVVGVLRHVAASDSRSRRAAAAPRAAASATGSSSAYSFDTATKRSPAGRPSPSAPAARRAAPRSRRCVRGRCGHRALLHQVVIIAKLRPDSAARAGLRHIKLRTSSVPRSKRTT